MLHRQASSTLFPYTTLFRSLQERCHLAAGQRRRRADLGGRQGGGSGHLDAAHHQVRRLVPPASAGGRRLVLRDRKSTRLNSSHMSISYAVFCLKKKIQNITE